MAPGDTARLYHRLTSYGPDRDWPPAEPPQHPLLLPDFATRDLATFTAPCKSYEPGLPTRELPKTRPEPTATATQVLAGKHPPTPLDLEQLARILFLSAGVVRTSERADGRFYHFRAAGSAGGRFPLEVYVAQHDGVHWYDPINARAGADRTAGRRRGDDADRHRRAVAHRLALRGARLPPPVLGRRHDARPDARARPRGSPVHAVPGRFA